MNAEPLNHYADNLADALALGSRDHVAMVGGGGKTSLMFSLAEELRQKGKRVITSTTTKILLHEALRSPCILYARDLNFQTDHLVEKLGNHGHLFVAQRVIESGKVEGIGPTLADKLYRDSGVDYMLVEADGSSGHPVKAHAEHEPVVPRSATKVVAMMGLDAMGGALESALVFRVDHFIRLTGLDRGRKLVSPILAKLFLKSGGLFKGAPPVSKRIAFLNKLDHLKDDGRARELADLITQHGETQIDRVIIGSVKKGVYCIQGQKDERYLS